MSRLLSQRCVNVLLTNPIWVVVTRMQLLIFHLVKTLHESIVIISNVVLGAEERRQSRDFFGWMKLQVKAAYERRCGACQPGEIPTLLDLGLNPNAATGQILFLGR
ncbi:uncharacterized protein LOC130988264 [Salvia miltiorrhiza]|uniref:uncharacterized protein LOC130988264 n=1 Tax=Salvia miltiorrhiza TaxID=226208 RepID=UPI0025AD3306|nr:uncharacterized protein LOC130988264 [Salvia miltiorrhiza]